MFVQIKVMGQNSAKLVEKVESEILRSDASRRIVKFRKIQKFVFVYKERYLDGSAPDCDAVV